MISRNGGERMNLKLVCLIGLLAISIGVAAVSAQDSSLRVVGESTVQVPADTTIIAVSAQNESENATLAAAGNSQLLNRTKDALIASGVKEDEIMPGRSKGYMTSHEVICNTANNTTTCKDVITNIASEQMIIKLKTSDPDRVQEVVNASETSGARAVVRGYALSDSNQAIDEARKKALEDAKARAEEYASSLGYKLGDSTEIEEPVPPDILIGPSYAWDMPMRMSHMSWMEPWSGMDRFMGGDYIPEGMAEVTAYVSVTYKVSQK
jgi:uncharacterized protein YggE